MVLNEYKAYLLLISVTIAWGVTFLMVQDAVNTTPVYSFLFFRFTLATILMGFISYKFLKLMNLKTIIYGSILGFLLFSAFATQTFGLKYTLSSIVAFITGLNVIFVPFLAFLIIKEKISLKIFLSTLVAGYGLYLLTLNGSLSFGFGELLSLFCAFLFALHIVFTGNFSKNVNIFNLVLVQFFTVSILSLIFSLSLEDVTFDIPYDFAFFNALIVTAIFATVYAFLVQTYVQQFITPSKTAIIFTLEPVSASFVGYFWGNEILSYVQILGAVLIISATLIAEVQFGKNSSSNK